MRQFSGEMFPYYLFASSLLKETELCSQLIQYSVTSQIFDKLKWEDRGLLVDIAE